jgi:hypothetical protein
LQAFWPSVLLQKPNTEATAGALALGIVARALGMAVRVMATVTPHTARACGIAYMKYDIACNMPIHGSASGWRPVRMNFAIGCAPSVGAAEVSLWERAQRTGAFTEPPR